MMKLFGKKMVSDIHVSVYCLMNNSETLHQIEKEMALLAIGILRSHLYLKVPENFYCCILICASNPSLVFFSNIL